MPAVPTVGARQGETTDIDESGDAGMAKDQKNQGSVGMEPWDEAELARRLLEVVHTRERRPLEEVPEPGPGAYALFGSPWRPGLADGTIPIYIGSCRSLAERHARHRRSLEEAGLTSSLRLLTLPTSSTASAAFAERLLIELYRPAWNVHVRGFGNRTPGARRSGRISSWDAAFPGRCWAVAPTPIERAVGLVDVAMAAVAPRAAGRPWPPLAALDPEVRS